MSIHDSRGFEAGSVEELDLMKKILTDQGSEMKLGKRLHAIWWDQNQSESSDRDLGFVSQ